MKNILLPTDFSKNSWNAINYALQLFKNETCNFYLLNTYSPTIFHVEYIMVEPAQFEMADGIRKESITQLNELKDKILKNYKNAKHSFEIISSFNSLIPEIKDIVESKAIDYLVMGTKGATGAKEILFGSNTVHVFKNVKCPILAIPDSFDFETLREVLFPTDFEIDYKGQHINPIIGIISHNKTRVNILHVSFGYELSEEQKKNKKTLETYFKKIAHLFHDVSNQTVEGGITHFQRDVRINLLVMVNNKHSFFENLFFKSTINQIGFHLNVPFLVIPSKS